MTAEIKALQPATKTVSADAIEKAEHLLGLVKAGEVESFVCAAFRPSRNWLTIISGQHNTLEKIGMLEVLKGDLVNGMDIG